MSTPKPDPLIAQIEGKATIYGFTVRIFLPLTQNSYLTVVHDTNPYILRIIKTWNNAKGDFAEVQIVGKIPPSPFVNGSKITIAPDKQIEEALNTEKNKKNVMDDENTSPAMLKNEILQLREANQQLKNQLENSSGSPKSPIPANPFPQSIANNSSISKPEKDAYEKQIAQLTKERDDFEAQIQTFQLLELELENWKLRYETEKERAENALQVAEKLLKKVKKQKK